MTLSDDRIRQLASETLAQVSVPERVVGGLEERLATLEARVRHLEEAASGGRALAPSPGPAARARIALPVVTLHAHASHDRFTLPSNATQRCVLEPDQPCLSHGTCKSQGY